MADKHPAYRKQKDKRRKACDRASRDKIADNHRTDCKKEVKRQRYFLFQNFYFIKETLASSLDFLNISSIAFTYSSKVITTEDPTKL